MIMFTGIVVEQGKILEAKHRPDGTIFRIGSQKLVEQLQVSDSISVDGACLTVVAKDSAGFSVEATPETLRLTNLGGRQAGDLVNLEPAARLSDFLGGHLVQGHVDQKGQVDSIRTEGNSRIFRFSAPRSLLGYCVMKGSITVNGVSLTISGLGEDSFEVTIIPHTLEVTNFSRLQLGDWVNLEADVISKYVEAHVKRGVGILTSLVLIAGLSFGLLQAGEVKLGANSVLVYKNESTQSSSQFVVRLARYLPDLVLEWESEADQGTVHLSRAALGSGEQFTLTQLFEVGVNNESRTTMTVRLSDWAFQELSQKGKVKLKVNRLPSKLNVIGVTKVELQLGGEPVEVDGLRIRDNRGGEWVLLDDPDAPLVLSYKTRHFSQTLHSIARPATSSLRWIKRLPPIM